MPILKNIFILFIFFLCIHSMNAQVDNDLHIIRKQSFNDELFTERNVKFGISGKKNLLVKYNPVNLSFGGLMYIYQKFISPQIQAQCLFVPSCSEFSRQLYNEYGFLKGTFATADRLTRCHRISATTINPVSINDHDHKVHESVNYYRISQSEAEK